MVDLRGNVVRPGAQLGTLAPVTSDDGILRPRGDPAGAAIDSPSRAPPDTSLNNIAEAVGIRRSRACCTASRPRKPSTRRSRRR